MSEHSTGEQKRVVNQTNRGSGTFVAGNVFGSVVNLFVSSQRQRPPASSDGSHNPEDDYKDVTWAMFGAFLLGTMSGAGLLYMIRGLPLSGTGPAPGLTTRFIAGFVFAACFFACVAAFTARAAQGLEMWAGRCADIAHHTNVRFLARLPASMARALAAASSVAATLATLLAAFYGWGEFGATVQERARIARYNAALTAARAQHAATGPQSH
ncbi:hypothetical protein H0H10_26870 [Streptomyces sp. TRM S81-3]|uniref:Uncharacterized protein n=1 Tax=Streptomyces griseicoloratus TaxID=2752516 RepID=A0A926L705_9ACTN|nr:hypothetical protein [Streptomyces griseicoloratus]MBD0422731.1 hypothetical protein [Streptomyces griseicoloratus]